MVKIGPKVKVIYNIKHILELPNNSILKQCLNISKKRYENNKESYYGNIINMLNVYYPGQTNVDAEKVNYQTKTIDDKVKKSTFWTSAIKIRFLHAGIDYFGAF